MLLLSLCTKDGGRGGVTQDGATWQGPWTTPFPRLYLGVSVSSKIIFTIYAKESIQKNLF